jgi:hypothetical protein
MRIGNMWKCFVFVPASLVTCGVILGNTRSDSDLPLPVIPSNQTPADAAAGSRAPAVQQSSIEDQAPETPDSRSTACGKPAAGGTTVKKPRPTLKRANKAPEDMARNLTDSER